MRELVFLPYSPWSQKAKWALDHHQVPYSRTIYKPAIGEPGLRLRLRRWRGKITVPVLFDGTVVLEDSWDIARRADELGQSAPLFFDLEAAHYWNELSSRALAAGRRRATDATLRDPEAQAEALTGIVPDRLRRPLRGIAVVVAKRFNAKYDAPPIAELEAALSALREALDGRDHILDRLSYADIAMAMILEFVSPGDHVRRSDSERRAWSDPEQAERYADLVQWRDRLVANHWPSNAQRAHQV